MGKTIIKMIGISQEKFHKIRSSEKIVDEIKKYLLK